MIYCMCFLAIFGQLFLTQLIQGLDGGWFLPVARKISVWKVFGKFMLPRFMILEMYIQSLKPTSQIPVNFHTRLGKFELLITVNREMISNWTFHQLFFLKRGNYGRQQFDWSRNNSWWRALTRKKFNIFGAS